MANLPETSGAAYPQLRQIEDGEAQGGGPTGLWNEHARKLIERTNNLKARLDDGQFASNFEITVGPGGQYTTLNAAIARLATMQPGYSLGGVAYTATIRLLAGFEVAEQVIVRGRNLGWAAIVSNAPSVVIRRTALTTQQDGVYPAFAAVSGGVLPAISALFTMSTDGTATQRTGILAASGGSVFVAAGCGVQGAGHYGALALQGGGIAAEGADFRNSAVDGVRATRGGIIAVQGGVLSGCGSVGVYCHKGGVVDCQGATITGCATSGIYCASSGRVDAASANARKGVSDSSSDIAVQRGGWVAADQAIGGLSQTANTLTASGVICR